MKNQTHSATAWLRYAALLLPRDWVRRYLPGGFAAEVDTKVKHRGGRVKIKRGLAVVAAEVLRGGGGGGGLIRNNVPRSSSVWGGLLTSSKCGAWGRYTILQFWHIRRPDVGSPRLGWLALYRGRERGTKDGSQSRALGLIGHIKGFEVKVLGYMCWFHLLVGIAKASVALILGGSRGLSEGGGVTALLILITSIYAIKCPGNVCQAASRTVHVLHY